MTREERREQNRQAWAKRAQEKNKALSKRAAADRAALAPKARARARGTKPLDPLAPDARIELLRRVARLLEDATTAGAGNAAVGAARLLLENLPQHDAGGLRFGTATEALAWWEANAPRLRAMAAAEQRTVTMLPEGET